MKYLTNKNEYEHKNIHSIPFIQHKGCMELTEFYADPYWAELV